MTIKWFEEIILSAGNFGFGDAAWGVFELVYWGWSKPGEIPLGYGSMCGMPEEMFWKEQFLTSTVWVSLLYTVGSAEWEKRKTLGRDMAQWWQDAFCHMCMWGPEFGLQHRRKRERSGYIEDIAQWVESLPNIHKALGSIPSTAWNGPSAAGLQLQHYRARGRKSWSQGYLGYTVSLRQV